MRFEFAPEMPASTSARRKAQQHKEPARASKFPASTGVAADRGGASHEARGREKSVADAQPAAAHPDDTAAGDTTACSAVEAVGEGRQLGPSLTLSPPPPMTHARDLPPPSAGLRRVRSMPAVTQSGGGWGSDERRGAGALDRAAFDVESVRANFLVAPRKSKKVAYDTERGAAFGSTVINAVNDAGTCVLISVGHQLGLFAVMAKLSDRPRSVRTIAAAANNLRARYVQELLSAMTCVGIVEESTHPLPAPPVSPPGVSAWMMHPQAGSTAATQQQQQNVAAAADGGGARRRTKYRLPAEHAVHLTWGNGSDNLALLTQYIPVLGRLEDEVAACFRSGRGLDWTRYGQFDLVSELDTAQTVGSVAQFEADVLSLVPGLPAELRTGTSILCLGSGVGSTIASIARAFPKSWFTVYETNGQKAAVAAAAHDGISNLHFASLIPDGEAATAATAAAAPPAPPAAGASTMHSMQEHRAYAAALVLDGSIIRDAAAPAALLRRVHAALRPGRRLLLLEYVAGGGSAAPLLLGMSALQSVPLGVAAGGPALGRGWGAAAASNALRAAGFANVAVHARCGDEINAVVIATAMAADAAA